MAVTITNLDGAGHSLVSCTAAQPSCYADKVDGQRSLIVDTELRNQSEDWRLGRFYLVVRPDPGQFSTTGPHEIATGAGRVWIEAGEKSDGSGGVTNYNNNYWLGTSGTIDHVVLSGTSASGTIDAHLGRIARSGEIDPTKPAIDVRGSWACLMR